MKEGMNEVFLGLGGNIGQRLAVLRGALALIEDEIGVVTKRSPIYETQAWGSNSEHLYLNQVIKIETKFNASRVLNIIGRIESTFGRKRTLDQNADRSIDIDILFFNSDIIDSPDLQVPHPKLHLRNFVLYPLCDIESEFKHPILLMSMAELKKMCKDPLTVKRVDGMIDGKG